MKLTFLGTGNAHAVDLYNTCFTIEDKGKVFLIDAGGGNGVLRQLRRAGIDYRKIQCMFVTHCHTDHILGAIWIMRKIGEDITNGLYEGCFTVYGNDVVIEFLKYAFRKLIRPKEQGLLGNRIMLVEVKDGDEAVVLGRRIVFFDIHSTKAKQFGFTFYYEDDKKLTCCGDEPYSDLNERYAKGSNWLLHEAFCLYAERDVFKPYEKKHTTVKEACQLAEKLAVNKLVLYHTEETHGDERTELYKNEGENYYSGDLLVPGDLEAYEL